MDSPDNYQKERKPTEKMSEAEIIEDIEILSSQDLGELLFNSRLRKHHGRRSLNIRQKSESVVRFTSLKLKRRDLSESEHQLQSAPRTAESQKHRPNDHSTNPQTMETGERTSSQGSPSDRGSLQRISRSSKGATSLQGEESTKRDQHRNGSRVKETGAVPSRQNPDRYSAKDSEALALSGILDEELPCLALELKDKVSPLPKDKPVSDMGSRSRRSAGKPGSALAGAEQQAMKQQGSVKMNKSLRSHISFEKSNYSFKSCLEFDNLTFQSLISPGFKSAKSRPPLVKSPSKTSKAGVKTSAAGSRQVESKMELFQELMFEMEQTFEYFDLFKSLPMEEPLITQKTHSSTGSPEQLVVTFAPKIVELDCGWAGRTYKKRVLVSRGTCVIRSTLRELTIKANQQAAIEGCSRVIKKSLSSYLDFDSDWDSRIQYGFKSDTGTEVQTTTVRIGAGKKFPTGKTMHYTFERSVDTQDFYSCKEDIPVEALSTSTVSSVANKWYILKHISKVEVLNPEFLKVDTYAEFVAPQDAKLGQARKFIRAWWLLGGVVDSSVRQ